MSSSLNSIDLEGIIPQDVCFDYYGKKVAIVTGDKVIVYIINSEGQYKKKTELKGHEGPILNCSFSHPQFNSLIATAGIDGKIIIHKENNNNAQWDRIFNYSEHKQTVTCLSFNPKINNKNALFLAIGYADGNVVLFTYINDNWSSQTIMTHKYGINALDWLNVNFKNSNCLARFVTGGKDNLIKIWNIMNNGKVEECLNALENAHDNSIKIIDTNCNSSSFNNINSNKTDDGNSNKKQEHAFLSVDIDDTIIIWTESSNNSNTNNSIGYEYKAELVKFNVDQKPMGITHATWSKDYTFLSVSNFETTYLYKKIQGEWVIYSSLNNEGTMSNYYSGEGDCEDMQ